MSYAPSVGYPPIPTMAPTLLPDLNEFSSVNSTAIVSAALLGLNSLPNWAHTVLAVTAISIGLICCFAGAKYAKFSGTYADYYIMVSFCFAPVFVLGFEVGAYVGLLLAHETYHGDNQSKARMSAAIVSGSLVGGLSLCVVKVAKLVTGSLPALFSNSHYYCC